MAICIYCGADSEKGNPEANWYPHMTGACVKASVTENRRLFEEGLKEITEQIPLQWPRIPRDRSVSRKQAQINADICGKRAEALQKALDYTNSLGKDILERLDQPDGPDAKALLSNLWAIYEEAGMKRTR